MIQGAQVDEAASRRGRSWRGRRGTRPGVERDQQEPARDSGTQPPHAPPTVVAPHAGKPTSVGRASARKSVHGLRGVHVGLRRDRSPAACPADAIAVAATRCVAPPSRVVRGAVLEQQPARRVRAPPQARAVLDEREQGNEQVAAESAPARLGTGDPALIVEGIARCREKDASLVGPRVDARCEESPDHRPDDPELRERDRIGKLARDGNAVVCQVAHRRLGRFEVVVIGLAAANSSMPVAAWAMGGVRDPEQVAAAQPSGHPHDRRVARGDPAHDVGTAPFTERRSPRSRPGCCPGSRSCRPRPARRC